MHLLEDDSCISYCARWASILRSKIDERAISINQTGSELKICFEIFVS